MSSKASELECRGHEVTSSWLSGLQDGHPDAECAATDEADVRRSDVFVLFSEKRDASEDRGRGGRHVEFGMAYAMGKRIIVVGERENVFHSLPGVVVVADWTEAMRAISL